MTTCTLDCSIAPDAAAMVTVAAYVPATPYTWEVCAPLSLAPSPKSQTYVNVSALAAATEKTIVTPENVGFGAAAAAEARVKVRGGGGRTCALTVSATVATFE